MGLKIVISSAVELAEKEYVKEKLREMEKLHIIKIDDLYDCAEHSTSWGIKSKQEAINNKILSADWFICLIPEQTVGAATWRELKLILEAHKKGLPVSISVFHPMDIPKLEDSSVDIEERVSFDFIRQQAEMLLENKEEQYWVSYQKNSKEDLQKQLHEEFIKLYYTDRIFRTQHLRGLAKLGSVIKAKELYFDEERADIANGFIENKYFPRRSVDGKLQEALMEQRKFIVILGAPGSGKTRAIYQLLADPQQLVLANLDRYALGALADKSIIILHQDNIHQVYQFLESEKDYDDSENTLSEYFLVCDQLKDVFGMLTNEELFKFFDMVVRFKHVHMIASSIPSAFDNFRERWKEYGRKPMDDDQLTKVVTIPQISSDDEESAMRNWMLNEMQGNSMAETIGDYIPKLNSYKQKIVKKLYGKMGELPYLPELLSAFQITETFRHDTALFLPILILRKNLYPVGEPTNRKEFLKSVAKVLNFLIANNVIWVRVSSNKGNQVPKLVKELQAKAFSLEYGMDDEEEFMFDDELFPDTPLSTEYSYGVNEIVWSELEQEDANRHMNQSETLLKDFQNAKDVVRAAKEFYRTFPSIKSLRRILPRIPHTGCYDEASDILWDFVYKKCIEMEPLKSDQEEFLMSIAMLIGRSKDILHVKDAFSILQEKNLPPTYNIIGEFYSIGQRLGKETKPEIARYVTNLRENFQMNDDSFFSMSRKIAFFNMSFDDSLEAVIHSKYMIHRKDGDKLLPLDDAVKAVEMKVELASLWKMLYTLAKRGETVEQWTKVLNLHQQVHVNLRRSLIHQYFSVVASQNKRLLHECGYKEPEYFMKTRLQTLMDQFGDIIADEDKESCFFYSVEASWNFEQAQAIYKLYFDIYKIDSSRLISTVLHTVRNSEFQKALNFLVEIDQRLKEKGTELNVICYNNLIKSAPNMGEALGVVPYLTHLQDHTLANILKVLKSKRKIKDKSSKTGLKQDSKIFYYAYSAVMRDVFFEQRKSPYVIGLLYDLATTPKHERFIREIFLEHLEEGKKRQLIDYSTGISSIRLQKNYRTLDEVWDIFTTCRNHYSNERMFINSELYSNLMRKILYLCKDEELLKVYQDKLRTIISEDFSRIIRDEYFFSAMYRFFPEKQVVDKEGNISKEFIKDMRQSAVTHINPLNNIMVNLRDKGFDVVWKFYEFLVSYYKDNGKRKMLCPEIRTVTCLMETVTTKEQFVKAEEASKFWCSESLLKTNKLFRDAYTAKKRQLGFEEDTDVSKERKSLDDVDKAKETPRSTNRDYVQRTNEIIELAIRDIYLYGSLTSTLFNLYLKSIGDIIDDIGKDQYMKANNAQKCKAGTYRNVLTNLIEKYPNDINFDAISYAYLIKFSPGEWDVKRWIKALKDNEDIYKYDMIVCATIAQNVDVCKADIDTALDYFEFWEDIVHDIGYDPSDLTSISEATKITKYDNVDDYDGYWLTRSTHCIREMDHYWHCLNQPNGFVDKTALRFIKRQMEIFQQYGVPFPKFIIKGHAIDFKQELDAKKIELPS